jgi:hypothetical protein
MLYKLMNKSAHLLPSQPPISNSRSTRDPTCVPDLLTLCIQICTCGLFVAHAAAAGAKKVSLTPFLSHSHHHHSLHSVSFACLADPAGSKVQNNLTVGWHLATESKNYFATATIYY